jgi:hypothetical protein
VFGKIACAALVVTVVLALASGVYEHSRPACWLRLHLRRRPAIDWSKFDETRAGWARGRR